MALAFRQLFIDISANYLFVTLRAKLSGAVYCNWSCLWVCVFVGLLPW